MENIKKLEKPASLGDAAVEGLISGIGAGVVMGGVLVLLELLAGIAPLNALAGFDVSASKSPVVGIFAHLAVAAVYGLVFGILTLVIGRLAAGRLNLAVWLVIGAVYGLVIFAIAEWFILPYANPSLLALPAWEFASAHVLYGVMLAWLLCRGAQN